MKKITVDFPFGGIKSYKVDEEGIVHGIKPAGAKDWGVPTIEMRMLGSVKNSSSAFNNYPVKTFSRDLRPGYYPVALDGEGSQVLAGKIKSVRYLKG